MSPARICGLLLVACAALGQSPQQEKEAALSRQMAAEVESRHELLGDRETDAFVARLAAPLGAAAGLPYRLTVKVLTADQPLATTLPGGYMYLSAGLIVRAKSQADLARTLAHQVAHLTLARVRVGASGTVPLVFLGGTGGLCSRFANVALPAACRQVELEADRLGGEYLRATGLDRNSPAAAEGFERIRKKLAKTPARGPRLCCATRAGPDYRSGRRLIPVSARVRPIIRTTVVHEIRL